MLAGSGLAAMSSLILFAPPQPYLVQVVYKITTALAITAAAFGWRSKPAAGHGGLLVCSAEYRPGGGGAAGRSAHRHAGSGYGPT